MTRLKNVSFFVKLFVLLACGITFTSLTKYPRFHVLAVCSKAKDHTAMMMAAKPVLEKMGKENNFTIDITDDTSLVNDDNLSNYQVFIQLQEAPFDMSYRQQNALEKFVKSGKGWIGVHAAGLTGRQFISPQTRYWQWFEDFMGGVVYSPHPAFQNGTVIIEDSVHPITRGLPTRFDVPDEWYEFDKSPRGNVHVLARADEATYKQNHPMGDHPIIWTNENYKHMVYIGIGHDGSLWNDEPYTTLVLNSIKWAAGVSN